MGAIAFIVAVGVTGQHCGAYGGYSYYPSYSYSYYTQPYYYPTYSYPQPYVHQVVKTKFVAVETPHYAALAGDYARSEAKVKEQAAITTQITQLAGAVDQLRQIVVATGQQQPAPQVQQVPQPAPVYQQPTPQVQAVPQVYSQPQTPLKSQEVYGQPQAPLKGSSPVYQQAPGKASYGAPSPPPIDPASASFGTSGNDGLAVLGRCAECHTAGAAKGGMTIFAAPGQLAALSGDDWQAIDAAIVEGRMPPPNSNGGPLSLAAVVAVHDFIRIQVGGGQGVQQGMALNRNPF